MGSLSGAARGSIPWADLEQKLAERRAAKAAGAEPPSARGRAGASLSRPWTPAPAPPPPDSGVRLTPQRPLSYSVYTIADIEALSEAKARRSSSFTPPPAGWADVKRSAAHLVRTFWRGWVCARSPRPSLEAVARVPLVQLVADLRIALRGVPWRTAATVAGASLGVLVVLLGLVLAAFDLTDDMKPTRTGAVMPAPLANNPTEPAGPAPAPAIELDDAPPATLPATKAAEPAEPVPANPKPVTAAAKRKQIEIFVP